MDKALQERTWSDLDAALDGIEETIGRKRKLQAMLRKVEEEKGTVPERIYSKVKAEYRKQLDEAIALLAPIERELGEAREAASSEMKELNSMINAAKEEKSELEFRFKVGEYDEQAFARKEHALRTSIEEKNKRKKDLLDAFKKYDGLYDAMLSGAEPSVERADRPNTPGPQDEPSMPRGTGTIAEQKESAAPIHEYENPQDWLEDASRPEEMKRAASDLPEDADIEPDRSENSDALFESLSDSRGEESGVAREKTMPDATIKTPGTPAAGKTPYLILKSPGGNEKRIPLLPITLSIGREHDNNIEVKDEEAARYHARVIYKNRQYCIESLDGSRNTLVNGKNVSRSVLQNGDTITIGKTSLVFSM
ncbi:MAG: FHA domain-containing protein [Chitinivibrionia bacterium]|nr:FHA domain-containing protein [Chitinivibrionia bacterium]